MIRPLLLGLALALTACGAKAAPAPVAAPSDPATEPDGTADETATEPAQVCCESFGYGAQMVKCCESYAWTAPDACVVPEGLVGGGKAVVADDLCPK